MKKLAVLLLLPTLLIACNTAGSGGDSEVELLKKEKEELLRKSGKRDSVIISFMHTMNEIEDNLEQIKEKEKILTINSGDVELEKTKGEQIVSDIEFIRKLMDQNRTKMATLKSELANANIQLDEFEKMIIRMTRELEEKDEEIAVLKEELASMNIQLEFLFEEYNERLAEMGEQGDKLHTAYYAYGTSKELKENQVITKTGGFIGIGQKGKLKNDFNRDYFTKIDTRETLEIKLNTGKVKLITNHPSDSYKLIGDEDAVEKLEITNAEEFWSISKYLVIVVE